MKSYDVVAYTYQSSLVHGRCLVDEMVRERVLSPAAYEMDPETVLDQHAAANGIDRTDEHTFDSDDFPKVVFADEVQPDDYCEDCFESLL